MIFETSPLAAFGMPVIEAFDKAIAMLKAGEYRA